MTVHLSVCVCVCVCIHVHCVNPLRMSHRVLVTRRSRSAWEVWSRCVGGSVVWNRWTGRREQCVGGHWCRWNLYSSLLSPFPFAITFFVIHQQAWVKYIIVLESNIFIFFTELVWCIRAYGILSKGENPTFLSSWLAQLHQARSTKHRKVF